MLLSCPHPVGGTPRPRRGCQGAPLQLELRVLPNSLASPSPHAGGVSGRQQKVLLWEWGHLAPLGLRAGSRLCPGHTHGGAGSLPGRPPAPAPPWGRWGCTSLRKGPKLLHSSLPVPGERGSSGAPPPPQDTGTPTLEGEHPAELGRRGWAGTTLTPLLSPSLAGSGPGSLMKGPVQTPSCAEEGSGDGRPTMTTSSRQELPGDAAPVAASSSEPPLSHL